MNNGFCQTWGQFNSWIGIDYFKENGIGIDKFWIGINVSYQKKLNPQIHLHFNFLTKKYFFHDNPTCNINYLE